MTFGLTIFATGLSPLAPQPRYGTFLTNSGISSAMNTRAHTPAPTVENGQAQVPMKPDTKKEVNLEPTWREMVQRVRSLLPYLWPSKSAKLQTLAVRPVLEKW